jgi:hypothetical protein
VAHEQPPELTGFEPALLKVVLPPEADPEPLELAPWPDEELDTLPEEPPVPLADEDGPLPPPEVAPPWVLLPELEVAAVWPVPELVELPEVDPPVLEAATLEVEPPELEVLALVVVVVTPQLGQAAIKAAASIEPQPVTRS